nr:MAG: DNA methylase [Bacteriophage sp.]
MKNNNEIQIQFVPIELLEYNNGQIPGVPENPRTREDAKQRNLEKSIEELPEMTIARAALCFPYNGKFVVIGGNRRLEAQRALKRKEVPIIALPEDTPVEKLRRIALLDNESTGVTDWEKLAKDWSKDEIRAWNIETPKGWFNEAPGKKAEEDNYTEPKKLKSRVKPGEIWQLGKHRLMCGDSTNKDDVARLMDGNVADLVFTDPTYNCNYGNIKHSKFKVREITNDNMDSEHFRIFCEAFCKQIKEYCRGCVYICAGQGEDGRTMFVVADRMLHNSTTIIWNKDQFTLGRGKYQNKYEPIWFGWVESGIDFIDNRTLTNVWDIKRPKKSELHPTMKPIELISTALSHNPGSKSVLDLFGGSGSTLIACEQLNRKCYMMELTEHYCDVIINRWETLTGRKAVKIG